MTELRFPCRIHSTSQFATIILRKCVGVCVCGFVRACVRIGFFYIRYLILAGYIEYSEFQPHGCEQKKILGIFGVDIFWGRNIWGKLLECTNRAKANTMETYRKQVWSPADWTFFGFYQVENLENAKNGEKRQDQFRIPSIKQCFHNFWTRIVERHWFPKLTSFWLHLTWKKSYLTSTKGSPRELRNLRQSLFRQMHHVHPYSMNGFLQLKTDGRPNKHLRNMEKKG